ncbi:DUF1134 domain-containing protein [Sphingorhabdus sp.]|uniref:DUF1134 domain-containing protein n=1 Tax=Sphingorhabdus sp. TaxID=1902408 RepID=UPI0032B785C3
MTGLSLQKFGSRLALAFATLLLVGSPVSAQIQTVDPNDAIDADLGTPPKVETPTATDIPTDPPIEGDTTVAPGMESTATPATVPPAGDQSTYQEDDLIGAAEGVFGKGAQGLGNLIEDILKKQGKPNGYIVGREGGGALVVGLRYGSGTLHHKVEGEKPVYWTGPSIGFDAGANAGSTFVLVYNLYDSEDLYRRFPSGEGVAYLVGGFNASYLRRGDIVLIPIRVGAGLRLGANVGYMKFSKKQRWLPF